VCPLTKCQKTSHISYENREPDENVNTRLCSPAVSGRLKFRGLSRGDDRSAAEVSPNGVMKEFEYLLPRWSRQEGWWFRYCVFIIQGAGVI